MPTLLGCLRCVTGLGVSLDSEVDWPHWKLHVLKRMTIVVTPPAMWRFRMTNVRRYCSEYKHDFNRDTANYVHAAAQLGLDMLRIPLPTKFPVSCCTASTLFGLVVVTQCASER